MPTKAKMFTKIIDKGADRIFAEIAKIDRKPFAQIGVIGEKALEKKEDSPLTNVEVATFHEYGGVNKETGKAQPPQRSFIRSTVDEKRAEFNKFTDEQFSLIMKGKATTETALGRIGMKIRSEIIKKINSGVPPPLAPSTIAAKGSSKPLIDTGQLRSSITHEVIMDGKG